MGGSGRLWEALGVFGYITCLTAAFGQVTHSRQPKLGTFWTLGYVFGLFWHGTRLACTRAWPHGWPQMGEQMNLGLHVIQYPTGTWGYVGSIPRALGNEVKATCEDIMAGRSYTNVQGAECVTKFPVFNSKRDALDNAFANGYVICEGD